METPLQSALQSLVDAVASQPQVRAVGLSGGQRPLPRPGEGDIDLFIYCDDIPLRQGRAAVLASLGALAGSVRTSVEEGGHWGVADTLLLQGVETWLMYFTLDKVRAELEAILAGQLPDRVDNDYYPIGRCAMFEHMRPLYDPDAVLESFKRRLAPYPAPLADALVRYHMLKLDDVEDLDRAVLRGDVLFYHFALDLALDHFLQALFALNRVYFPSRKRSLEHIEAFQNKPADCAARLAHVVECGAQPGSLSQSRALWAELVRDLQTCSSHVP